ncbi:bifunctional RNA recognition motif domain/NCBP2 [Babesia duncani]|uniref:Nuclear cap-binding protein subunit 2 n=1 Tax=Babesia duncani TaxID=323732 RepID=A0AAD9UPK3_9APIC|nr:bifunctional RNA recognition motif domain/NCBP2 [Babesia duncani]
MADLYNKIITTKKYWDKRLCSSIEEWNEKIANSSTVYVGNLAFTTPEERIHEVFQAAGRVDRVVLGLNSIEKNPCGFAFVVYNDSESAKRAIGMFKGCIIDGRVIRVDADPGENIDTDRKLARGINGYQWRDVFRNEFDTSRGGQGLGIDHGRLNSGNLNITPVATTLVQSNVQIPSHSRRL